VARKKEPLGNPLVGKRVQILNTDDPYTKLPMGTWGTVTFLDDMGTVHVQWDDGSSLGLILGQDKFRIGED
jgi:hypothetical protein